MLKYFLKNIEKAGKINKDSKNKSKNNSNQK